MIPLFCGFEAREALGFHVFVASAIRNASSLLNIVPLAEEGLPRGSNAFTRSRFLVPHLMGHEGAAIFADASDMLVLGDLAELFTLFDPRFAVQVVKHREYKTKHKVKYRGTPLETLNLDYPRKNWASLMLFNCAHPAWAGFTPERLARTPVLDLLQFKHLPDECIGELPPEWNRLVDEGHPVDGAKLMHWTVGIPGFPEYQEAPGADHWHRSRREVL